MDIDHFLYFHKIHLKKIAISSYREKSTYGLLHNIFYYKYWKFFNRNIDRHNRIADIRTIFLMLGILLFCILNLQLLNIRRSDFIGFQIIYYHFYVKPLLRSSSILVHKKLIRELTWQSNSQLKETVKSSEILHLKIKNI